MRDIDASSAIERARTLLRFVYGIAGLGVACAIAWQFGPTHRVATGLLASGAVLAVVIGLAAQGTLGNPIAGVVLAFAQPIRVGDKVTIDNLTGHVVRIGVSYTRIDVGDGTHVEFPNSLLATLSIVVERGARPPHGGQAPSS